MIRIETSRENRCIKKEYSMRKYIYSLFVFSVLSALFFYCNYDPVRFNEKITTASYDPIEKLFIVTFDNNETEVVEASLNTTYSPTKATAILENGTQLTVNDATEAGEIFFQGKGNYESATYESGMFKVNYSSGFIETLKATIIYDLDESFAVRDFTDGSALLYKINSSENILRITRKGKITSASYNNRDNNKFFTLRYDSGYRETIDAYINNETSPPSASASLQSGVQISVPDATVDGEATLVPSQDTSENGYVNKWIHENMSIYYLWNYKLPENSNFSLYPSDFFFSLINEYGTGNPEGDRDSWIQENYVELLGNLSGVSSNEIGFEYVFIPADNPQTHYYALVLYPFKGSDAETKGINRGRFITQIDGQNITSQNYRDLFGGVGSKRLSMADLVFNPERNSYLLTDAGDITIQMHENFAENPVYFDNLYTIGSKKIGYLVYNFFGRDRGNNSTEYDRLLMDRLRGMQSQGVNEMVLDLRYNSGGAVSSAISLASALVKNRSTSNTLVTSQYNSIVHNSLSREYGEDYNIDYFTDRVQNTTIAVPSLNLPRLYVLTSGWTASASELVINGLKPYMEVVLIGETTYGKNVGSISIYEEDDPKNKWGMQPIVVKYFNSDGKSDFTNGFTPDYEINEFEYLPLQEFGSLDDPLLDIAISLITGKTLSARSTMKVNIPFRSAQLDKRMTLEREVNHRFEMYDDVRGEDIRKIMSK